MSKVLNLIKIPMDWQKYLGPELKKDYMLELDHFLAEELKAGKAIYPKLDDIFNAFKLCSLADVKVVIIGQDPYHGVGQAHGLSFSVRPGVKIPPSLKNIYKELESDIGVKTVEHGFLDSWAKQGVLLLNSVLTVQAGQANSHQKKGWEIFTDSIIKVLNEHGQSLVFLLWGSPAQKKGKNIDESKHLVLKSVHPSPLSAYRGFFGCQHFSKTNKFLAEHGRVPIEWQLPALK